MLINYFKAAWRRLQRDRQFSVLNLAGLSLGLASVFLIYCWVSDEWNTDRFHKNGDRLYQVIQNIPNGDGTVFTTEATPDQLAKTMMREVPEVEQAVTVKMPDWDGPLKGVVSVKGTGIKAIEAYVTPNFFDVFSFTLLQGSKDQVLAEGYNVMLSDAMARKLFNTTDGLIGKTIKWNRGTGDAGFMNGVYTISGIFQAPATNSSLQFDLLFPFEGLYSARRAATQNLGWFSSNPSTFLLLRKGVDPGKFDTRCQNFIRDRYKGDPESQKQAGVLFIQRFEDRYLHSSYENGKAVGGRIEYVRLFSLIAVFLLVIACINFMNLSTAKASNRMKEVGVRKCIGASRRSLVVQYLSESILMAGLSLVLAIGLVWLLLPAFREITGKNLALHFSAGLVGLAAGITILTGLLAGSYPALYLSGFQPVRVLKGKLPISIGEALARKGLVVFQFSLSVVLIVAVLVVYKQMELIQTKNLGYNKDHVIRFSNEGELPQNLPAFLSEVRNLPGVVRASDLDGDFLGDLSSGGGIDWPGKTEGVFFSGVYAGDQLVETMGLQLTAGRSFTGNPGLDSGFVLFNETAIAMMKLKDPIGKTVSLWGKHATIIGVLKDFHYQSLYKKIGPFFMGYRYRNNTENIFVRVRVGSERATLASLTRLYQRYNPGLPFEYSYIDEDFQKLYASEQRVAVLSRYFAGIAILVSCLGLFGLTAFTAQKREKEIGIRKVVGASSGRIALLLSADFLKWVGVAVGIAFPLSWWAMSRWLAGFAYRTHIGAGVFLVAGASILLITLGTVGFQAIKAAVANPVKALRNE